MPNPEQKIAPISDNGIVKKGDYLYVDTTLWTMKEDAVIKGKSGLQHRVDFCFNSADGKKVIIIKAERYLGSVFLAIGKIQIIKEDLDPSEVFVVCSTSDLFDVASRIASQIDVKAIRSVKFGYPENDTLSLSVNHSFSEETDTKHENVMKNLRRDHTRLIMEVMSLLREKKSKITYIIYKCNLNYRSATDLLDELISKGYLKIILSGEGEKSYILTREGNDALMTIQKFYG